jgi:hypothetical protein
MRAVLSFPVLLLVAGCSTTTSNDAAPTASGPPIGADQVGTACSGVGTSPGDTATFQKADCPSGLCVADARGQLDTYCTADCTGRTCPDGFSCQPITFGDAQQACLKDPGASGGGGDAGSGSSTPPPPSGPIGNKTDKGVKSVNVNLSSHGTFTCTNACKTAGGTCDAASCANNGCGWTDIKYNDGSGTFGSQISSCDEYQHYSSGTSTMTDMSCFCDGLPVPTTVRVTKSQGLFTCSAVCASWSLTCSATRNSYAYADATASSEATLTCGSKPVAATTDHYVCACDP